MKKMNIGLRARIIISSAIFILTITVLSMAVVYYWSFIHFSTMFEDRVIDEYVLEQKEELGIYNEWILGTTTHSIDVVREIHGDETASVIQDRAEKQEELSKLYREVVDGKHLIYMINLDTKNGETIYEYSIIKDIYAEIFPKIVAGFLCFSLMLVVLSICYTQYVSKRLYSDLQKLGTYTRRIARKERTDDVVISTHDKQFENLLSDLQTMQDTIEKEDAIRQSTLQYISHEMKTPIMIIEGYATSAKDHIYPKGSMQTTLDTILTQTERMKQKVSDLLTIVRLESAPDTDRPEVIGLRSCIDDVFSLLASNMNGKKVSITLDPEHYLVGNKEKFKILFENLISNQIKYAQSLFSISEKVRDDCLYLYFYNDGAVISSDVKKQIFQPFVKGYNGSTGLGLSICRTIMRQQNGDIWLQDTKKGTLFVVKIPSGHWEPSLPPDYKN